MTMARDYARAWAATPQGREWLRYFAEHAHTEEQRRAAAELMEDTMPDRLTPPDPSQRGIAEAIDHADLMARGHGLGSNADNFARLPDRGRADPLAIIVIGAAVSFGVVLGAILRGMWG